MSVLGDPGFELGGVWTLANAATITTAQAQAGTKSLRLRHVLGLGGETVGSATSEEVASVPGQMWTLRLWAFSVISDAGAQLSNLRIDLDAGTGGFVLLAQLQRLAHDDGWLQSVEYGFESQGDYVKIRLRTLATSGSGVATIDWYCDTVDLLPVGAVAVAKHLALAGLVTRLKAIDGTSAGYYTDLGNRVYTRLFYPEGPASGITMPYACVPLIDDAPQYVHRGNQNVTAKWTMRIFIFVPETSSSKVDSVAAESAAKVHDDVWRAIMDDLTLGDSVLDLTIVSSNSWAGDDDGEAPYGEVQFALEVMQRFQRSDLGPSAS